LFSGLNVEKILEHCSWGVVAGVAEGVLLLLVPVIPSTIRPFAKTIYKIKKTTNVVPTHNNLRIIFLENRIYNINAQNNIKTILVFIVQ
jgi:hypothetical protein